eukprot:m.129961 g.129961  ORF g.129961 m.129961 type:complete len:1486 (-) comp14589_c0_seq4:516-4973(-)
MSLHGAPGGGSLRQALDKGDVKLVQNLLEEHNKPIGFNIDARDESGSSALHWASRRGNLPIVKLLVNARASVLLANNQRKTPIDIASDAGHVEIQRFLSSQTPARSRVLKLPPVTSPTFKGSEGPNLFALKDKRDFQGYQDDELAFSEGDTSSLSSTSSSSLSSTDTSDDEHDDHKATNWNGGHLQGVQDFELSVSINVDRSLMSPEEIIKKEMRRAMKVVQKRVRESRVLTIFLSSPFNGLRIERDVFTQRYLPLLRDRALNQGIHVKVVDLRWGISSEDSAAGKTLWTCLSNVEKSDIFIGFYGARYGTVYNPQDKTTGWVKKDFDYARHDFPWIDQFKTRSVTELEFRYGWLNKDMPNGLGNARGTRLAAFYFRDPRYDQNMTKQDPKNIGAYINRHKSDEEKLNALKKECEGCARTTYYNLPEEAAVMFKNQCEEWMDEILPNEKLSEEGREDAAHFSFQAARTAMYVQSNKDQIGGLIADLEAGNSRVFCVEGDAGSGKSALLANVCQRISDEYQEHSVFSHYIGCSSRSTHLGYLLGRAISKLSTTKKPPRTNRIADLALLFLQELQRFAHSKKTGLVILILDGLNNMDEEPYRNSNGVSVTTSQLSWFPQEGQIPLNVRVLVSFVPSKTLNVLHSRSDVKIKQMPPLHKNERRNFCNIILDKAGKRLKKAQLSKLLYGESYSVAGGGSNKDSTYIVKYAGNLRANGKFCIQKSFNEEAKSFVYLKADESSKQLRLERVDGTWRIGNLYKNHLATDTPPSLGWVAVHDEYKPVPKIRCLEPPTYNPLFLKLAVEELCAFGSYEQLDGKIEDIASCGSIATLLLLTLERLEEGFEGTHPGAVRTLFSQIWYSVHGLTLDEMCEVCGINEGVKSADWSLLFTAVSSLLVASQKGRYTFINNYIKHAVGAKYCPTLGHKWAVASTQLLLFTGILENPNSSKESREHAAAELEDLQRFVDCNVLSCAEKDALKQELDLSDQDGGEGLAVAVGQSLAVNFTITTLNLQGNNILDVGAKALMSGLQQNDRVTYVDLRKNRIGSRGALSIGQALQNNNILVYLDLSNNKISGEGGKSIGKGIAGNKSLTVLKLGNNNSLGNDGFKSISSGLVSNKTLEELDLESTGATDAKLFLDAAGSNKGLRVLNLSGNKFGAVGSVALLTAFKKHTTLENLNMSGTGLENDCGQALGDLAVHCSELTSLNIKGNKLGDSGCVEFATQLLQGFRLTALNLADNEIGNDGAIQLSEAFSVSNSLLTLDLSNNRIGESGCSSLLKYLHDPNSESSVKFSRLWKSNFSYVKRWKSQKETSGFNSRISPKMSLQSLSKDLSTTSKQVAATSRKGERASLLPTAARPSGPGTIRRKISRKASAAMVNALESLDLSSNRFKSEAQAVGQVLQRNSNLRTLGIQSNKLSKESVEIIMTGLQVNVGLKEIFLSDCDLQDPAFKLLGLALKDNKSLIWLISLEIQCRMMVLRGSLSIWMKTKS